MDGNNATYSIRNLGVAGEAKVHMGNVFEGFHGCTDSLGKCAVRIHTRPQTRLRSTQKSMSQMH